MNNEIDKMKYHKREQLRVTRNKNMKKAIWILIVSMILLISGNHVYNNYREKIYRDKRDIQFNNEYLIREFIHYLEFSNDVITQLIFDVELDKAFTKGRMVEAQKNASLLSWVRYDRELYEYQIDSIYTQDFIYSCGSVIIELLNKEEISNNEKVGLVNILDFNRKIVDTYREIINQFYPSDKREELHYLYYYKGEMRFVLNNAIAVYMDGVDTNFVEERKVGQSNEEELLSESMVVLSEEEVIESLSTEAQKNITGIMIDNDEQSYRVSFHQYDMAFEAWIDAYTGRLNNVISK